MKYSFNFLSLRYLKYGNWHVICVLQRFSLKLNEYVNYYNYLYTNIYKLIYIIIVDFVLIQMSETIDEYNYFVNNYDCISLIKQSKK